MNRQTELLKTIEQAVNLGMSVWPPRQEGSKAPFGKWADRQHTPATLEELLALYREHNFTGIGLICGKVSGNIECLDFDERGTYEAFKEAAVATGLGPLLARIEAGYMEASPKGVHLPYRCAEIGGSLKLATRPDEMGGENDTKK